MDDHFLLKYRELLDNEDVAFDGLEHASEEGDRIHFDEHLAEWENALAAKLSFLQHSGIELPLPATT